MYIQNTLTPYKKLDYDSISYTSCRDYDNLNRYKGLRQIIHSPNDQTNRMMTLESPNPFITTDTEVIWHTVQYTEENRLDLIAEQYLGSAEYAWVISYFNQISDGFTCHEGQTLRIPKSVSDLMKSGEILAPVPALKLNLGTE